MSVTVFGLAGNIKSKVRAQSSRILQVEDSKSTVSRGLGCRFQSGSHEGIMERWRLSGPEHLTDGKEEKDGIVHTVRMHLGERFSGSWLDLSPGSMAFD